ncbi:hypothetical protein ACFWYW_52475 [Nonomuraea sp. NPDC059023]|uniref:hypothetical protein n=1 Tax=unclassified Nonomuraea TaxID=2593643 RepID=UPI00368CDB1B
MEWSTLAPALFSLLGAVVGAAGTFLGTFFATRTTRQQAQTQRIAALRQERKEAILAFLDVAQDMQVHTYMLWHRRDVLGAEREIRQQSSAYSKQVWRLHRRLSLVGSRGLLSASHTYVEALDSAMWTLEEGTTFWDHIDPIQDGFLDAARTELSIPDEVPRR